MTQLVNQPTAMPTRKWWSVVITGALVGSIYTALDTFWPGHPFEAYRTEVLIWGTTALQGAVAYMTRNRA